MAPDHKLRLVSAFQARGDVVAVTGDGVNDAPALRKADVGISMGIIGTDVAKEAADIVLTTDNFGAIASAIEEGRGIFDNIRKFITYIFSSNVPEILPFMVTGSFPGIPLALTVRQILAIDLGTDIFPALALGIEKPEPDVMKRPPRPRRQPLLDRGLVIRAFVVGIDRGRPLLRRLLCGLHHVGQRGRTADPRHQLGADSWEFETQHSTRADLCSRHHGLPRGRRHVAGRECFRLPFLKVRSTHLGWLSNRYLLLGVALEIAGIFGHDLHSRTCGRVQSRTLTCRLLARSVSLCAGAILSRMASQGHQSSCFGPALTSRTAEGERSVPL